MPPKKSPQEDFEDIWDAPWALLPGVWGRQILIFARGARGDVQPACVLGARLVSEGGRVLVLTNVDQVQLVRSFGLRAEGTQFPWTLESRPHLTPEFAREVFEAEKRVANRFSPDLIYECSFECNGNARRLSELLKVPLLTGVFRMDFQHVYDLPGFTTKIDVFDTCEKRPALLNRTCLHYSSLLGQVPAELAQSHQVTGFLHVPQQEQLRRLKLEDPLYGGNCKAKLETFLQLGSPPVCVTFGSMEGPLGTRDFLARLLIGVVVRGLLQAGLRGVLVSGSVPLENRFFDEKDLDLQSYAENNIFFVNNAPHAWLFPRCSMVVHHGGIGTAGAALRAGLPSVTLLSVASRDQKWNAHILQSIGCGLALHENELLGSALTWCSTSEAMRDKCAAMQNRLEEEDGVTAAVASIDRFMREEVDSGAWRESMDSHLAERRLALDCLRERGGKPCANHAVCGLCATWHGEWCCAACSWGQGHGPKCDRVPIVPAEKPQEQEANADGPLGPSGG
jgi:UDP:flavonoid glycosyltransferase YjiC (YdhE family)